MRNQAMSTFFQESDESYYGSTTLNLEFNSTEINSFGLFHTDLVTAHFPQTLVSYFDLDQQNVIGGADLVAQK